MLRKPLVLAYIAFALIPVLWVVMASFKSTDQLFANPWSLPTGISFVNYVGAWKEEGLGQGFLNSVIACLGTLVILLPIGAMAAYVLTHFQFRGRNFLSLMFMGGMMFPNFLTVVPLYFQMVALKGADTMWGLIIAYVAYSLSFTVFVLSGFFAGIPGELAEAAQLDGCSESATFWKVMWPLARPGVLVVGIFNAIGLWNEYPLAVILMSSAQNRTLPLKIADMALSQQYQSNWGYLFAGLVLSMLPVVLVYIFTREKVHQAMIAGALKG